MFRITPPTSHFVRAPTTLPSSQARDLQRGPFRALLSDQDPPEAKTGGPEHRGLWVLTLSSFPRHSPSRGAKWPRGADACGAPWPRRRPLALPGRPGWPCATGPRTGTKVALQHASLPAKREAGGWGCAWAALGQFPWQPLALAEGGGVRDPSKQAKKASGAGSHSRTETKLRTRKDTIQVAVSPD